MHQFCFRGEGRIIRGVLRRKNLQISDLQRLASLYIMVIGLYPIQSVII